MKTVDHNDIGPNIDWSVYINAIDAGHALPKAEVKDVFLGSPALTMLSRAARIEGLGCGVKSVTVVPDNADRRLPSVQGGMLVFDDLNGSLRAVIDSGLVTDIKTAADSVLGARYLARLDSETLLVVGVGRVAENVIRAYCQTFVNIKRIMIWNRTKDKAQKLANDFEQDGINVTVMSDLAVAVAQADIVATATMSISPILLGDWVRPGTHVDLIGAFRADMREADDALLKKSKICVDSRETTMHHIGEIKIPLDTGVITANDIIADLYQLKAGVKVRSSRNDITVFKNGGGAHLDLMIADAVLASVRGGLL